jgi:hypothetical protein
MMKLTVSQLLTSLYALQLAVKINSLKYGILIVNV